MPLQIGARIGVYEVTGALGAGGMGEVYRARDTSLGRDVAIKVLPQSVAGDVERLARFDREAKALAALSALPGASAVTQEAEKVADVILPAGHEAAHPVRGVQDRFCASCP
jgi:serine/threonine protein kinase